MRMTDTILDNGRLEVSKVSLRMTLITCTTSPRLSTGADHYHIRVKSGMPVTHPPYI